MLEDVSFSKIWRKIFATAMWKKKCVDLFLKLNLWCILASTETTVDLLDRIVGRMIYVGQFSGAWKQQNLDLLLSPGWPIPAPPKHAQPSLVGLW